MAGKPLSLKHLADWSDKTALGALLACGVIGPLGMAPQETCIVLATAAWLVNRLCQRRWPARTAVTGLLIAWFLIAALSLTQTEHLPTSLKGLQKLLKYFGLFYAACETLRTRERIQALFQATLIGALITSLNGWIQVAAGADLFYHRAPGIALGSVPRLMSTFAHPNDYGIYAVTVLPVCLVAALSAAKSKPISWRWVAVLALVGSLPLTFSRPSALAVIISLAAFLLIRRAWKSLAAAAVFVVCVVLFLPQSVKEWAASQPSWLAVLAQPLRFEIWQAGWAMVRSHPWLGIGANMFVRDYIHYRIPGDAQVASYGHNHYLQLAAEIGVFGLAAFLGILLRTALAVSRLLKDKELWVRQAAQGAGCGMLAFLVIGLLESALQSSRCNAFFWIWLGLLHALAAARLGAGARKGT